MGKKISIKLIRSTIGQRVHVCKTVRSLGLGKLNSVVEKEANPAILGMVRTVSHLVEVKELN
ncbi:50S ribosomal protein L30 [Treponema phagedenis]|uniref:Large ribosomal subunit protein uL30 n=1 Tax=Treponema phagedenis TaxID=162 RepID=A0A0B7GX54_TREPH|nr:50S ribosomal protein L30 [Treponema phagedenis]EFW36686.1 ribosomal protein L30 [Treponema phagedenis F0421]NVP24167.1 50S ribosomal protein L30 [Treponema phagedenis]QEJ96321.1 50S ribosomal protein L30 [Treponema phagedenis]QEJ99271.1 50S ribosomal protein L30 [Treponema phagedenis]QEK00098.1 50S ribosomal protein L30 [Treponema phagedenis]